MSGLVKYPHLILQYQPASLKALCLAKCIDEHQDVSSLAHIHKNFPSNEAITLLRSECECGWRCDTGTCRKHFTCDHPSLFNPEILPNIVAAWVFKKRTCRSKNINLNVQPIKLETASVRRAKRRLEFDEPWGKKC